MDVRWFRVPSEACLPTSTPRKAVHTSSGPNLFQIEGYYGVGTSDARRHLQ